MKKIAVILIALMSASSSFAQEKSAFTMGLALGAGTDGIGVDVAFPLGKHFAVRGGYAFTIPYAYFYDHVAMGGSPINDSKAFGGITDWNPKAEALLTLGNGRLLFDFFPGKKGSFHFTAGAHIFTRPGIIHAQTTEPLPIGKENYARTFVEANGKYITTDPDGNLQVDVRLGTLPVKPYVGIGWGRIKEDSRVSVMFDMGAIYCGSIQVVSYDYGVDINASPTKPVANSFTSADTDGNDAGVLDILGKVPVWPVMKLSIAVRLF